ncbi:type 2 periplasmic-binding domain-containing protein [Parenemella sanctibonifatiensis]|uniref:Extracellular solute-binding protein n=1 Tax=Parenemella sanctibonifatiensis TaxID=2016505 RepID=A0A255EBF7_9ACTN|nr:hypothetical protein [Parenemella sanctibonifatiensis]OYN88251.1 hypothetical protein CGZ92_04715 [Parenemella sanctibonifatiensis]
MSTINRRTLLSLTGAATLGMAACSTSGSGNGGTGGGAGGGDVAPPNHVPFGDVTPDLPGNEAGVINGYLSYPQPPVVRDGFPLPETAPVTALIQGDPPPVPPEKNPVYDHFKEQAGNDFDATAIISTEYNDRFQVTMASNDIPDLVQIGSVPEVEKLLEARFTDLTEVLAGSSIEQYPALASFTDANWDVGRVNGRLFGIPQPRPPAGRVLLTRGDLLAEHGMSNAPELSDGEDFVELLTTLNNPGEQVFALGGDPRVWLLQALREMHGTPFVWDVQDGKFVHEMMTEETTAALSEGVKIVQAGLTHPNAFTEPGANHGWYRSGVTPLLFQGFVMWSNYARSNPEFDTGVIRLPNWEGGGKAPVFRGAAGYGAYVAIAQQESEERLHEILRIVDYIASPFGTQQYLDIAYGLEGQTFEFVDGEPTFIEGKSGEALTGIPYIGGGSQNVLYIPGRSDVVELQHAYLSEAIPSGTSNASSGLFSETSSSDGAPWNRRRKDLERSILLGEQPISAWEEFTAQWRADVGDKIAGELEEAAAAG